jgi:hypothetical protein
LPLLRAKQLRLFPFFFLFCGKQIQTPWRRSLCD